MVSKLVSVRMPEQLIKESEEIVKEEGFRNIQELITSEVRVAILKRRRLKALKWLKDNLGIAKNKKTRRMTKAQKEKMAMGMTEDEQDKIIKELGLEGVTI